MRKFKIALVAAGAAVGLTLAAAAQGTRGTNAPATEIENFEAQTNVVIIKAFGQVGSVSIGNGAILVICKDSTDVNSGIHKYGVVIELTADRTRRQRAVVDEDELGPLVGGIDYLGKISSDAGSLSGFEAEFKTKSGLRFIAHSSHRRGIVERYIQFPGWPRIPLNTDQMSQLENLVSQAQNTINSLKQK